MECKIKGSYTIEMAMISGVWLLILFASLLLLLGSYERVWDTAGACETAVYGSTMAELSGKQMVYRRQEKHQELGRMLIQYLEVNGKSQFLLIRS